MIMSKVMSKDGTTIAFDKLGQGPAMILVNGAMGYREFFGGKPLAAELSNEFTVYDYDRRGRGESTDTQPYAVEREIEDIEALIEEAGGSAYLYGISSGAVLALKAATKLGPAKVSKLALYEPPFNSDDDNAKQEFAAFTQRMAELLAANQRGEAVAFFMADMLPPEMIEGMRQSPEWLLMEGVAHTLAYDNAVLGDGAVPAEAAHAATMPTLVMDGGESAASFHDAAQALVDALPNARYRTLERQTHAPPDPEALAPVLAEFLAGSR
jgi:pimeloyl-ACP methyl ester carboxylesterase